MQNDRRRFLVGGAAGLTSILVPNASLACFCCRRRRIGASVSQDADPRLNCPFFNADPTIPNASSITPNSTQSFTVSGTGVSRWSQLGGSFTPSVVDNNSAATWGPCTVTNVGSDNTLTFTASETGSTSGTTSNITITVTLPAFNRCFAATWVWPPQQVTYR